MTRDGRVLVLFLLSCLGACRGNDHQGPRLGAAAAVEAAVRKVEAEVCGLVDAPRPCAARISVRTDFATVQHDVWLNRLLPASDRERRELVWAAFGFIDPPIDSSSLSRAVRGDAPAIFDESTRTLVVRQDVHLPLSRDGELAIVHELAHDISFRLNPMLEASLSVADDKSVAEFSIREAFAQAVVTMFVAKKNGKRVDAALVEAGRLIPITPRDALVARLGLSPGLFEAPLIVRDAMLFAGSKGLALIALLANSGGMPLVHSAIKTPPHSFSDVVFPERYLGGLKPDSFDELTVSSEMNVLTTGRLGMVGLNAFIERCMPTPDANRVVNELSGDRYWIFTATSGRVVVIATSWTTEEAASAAESAVKSGGRCTGSARVLPAQFEVLRRGRVLAMVHGADTASAGRILTQAIGAHRNASSSPPPLGRVELKPLPDARGIAVATPAPKLDIFGKGTLSNGKYMNRVLGFEAVVPPGFSAHTSKILEVELPLPHRAVGLVMFEPSRKPFTAEHDFFASIANPMSKHFFGDGNPQEVSTASSSTPFGDAVARTYRIRLGATVVLSRLMVLPVCSGRAGLVVVQFWNDNMSEAAIDEWSRSFKPLREASVCSVLPKE